MEQKNIGSLEPGMELLDYRILEYVGEGARAYVYKAQDQRLRRLVAVKQLKPELVEDENTLQRFLREAHIVARLSNPNVVTIYDFGHDEKTNLYYIITEFAEKGTLADHLRDFPEGLPLDEVCHLAMGICQGLEAAHRVEVIHRDIKPGNILLFEVEGSRDIPKLCDFGIAKAPQFTDVYVPKTSGVVGTFYYMSPEQLDEGLEIDCRSDLYSLGIVLYELLTGQIPFTGDIPAVFWSHMYVLPTPPSKLRQDIPEALEQIVLRALQKESAERYQNATDMRKALAAYFNLSVRWGDQCKSEDLIQEGLVLVESGKWVEAFALFTQPEILELGDKRVEAALQKTREQLALQKLYERGVQSVEAGNWRQAQQYLADVVSFDPDYAAGQAREYLDLATQELERERLRSDLMVEYRRAMGYIRGQQWRSAIDRLKHIVDQDPEFEDAAERLREAQQALRRKTPAWLSELGHRRNVTIAALLVAIAIAMALFVFAHTRPPSGSPEEGEQPKSEDSAISSTIPLIYSGTSLATGAFTDTSTSVAIFTAALDATSLPTDAFPLVGMSTISAVTTLTPTVILTIPPTSIPAATLTPTGTITPTGALASTNTSTPPGTITPTGTLTLTGTLMPMGTPTGTLTPTPMPTSTSAPGDALTFTAADVSPDPVFDARITKPEDGATFHLGQELSFLWTGPEPTDPDSYYEVRLDEESLGQAWFNMALQQWESKWIAQGEGWHEWRVVLMASNEQTELWSSLPQRLQVQKAIPSDPDPPPP